MRHYYATEEALPTDAAQLQRICRAHSVDELEAIPSVLSQFFSIKNGAYHNARCDEELRLRRQIAKKYKVRAKLAASKRWSKRSATSIPEVKLGAQDVTDTVTYTKEEPKSIRAHFAIPSLGEITAYCEERNRGVNPQDWFNYYSARGWKYKGGVTMKDWRAAVRTWEKNGYERPNTNRPEQTRPIPVVAGRFHNNRAERERTFGAAVGGQARNDGHRQEAGLGTGDTRVLVGEITKLP